MMNSFLTAAPLHFCVILTGALGSRPGGLATRLCRFDSALGEAADHQSSPLAGPSGPIMYAGGRGAKHRALQKNAKGLNTYADYAGIAGA